MGFSPSDRPGKAQLTKLVKNKHYQWAVLGLIMLDLMLIIASLILEVFYPEYEFMVVTCDQTATAHAPSAHAPSAHAPSAHESTTSSEHSGSEQGRKLLNFPPVALGLHDIFEADQERYDKQIQRAGNAIQQQKSLNGQPPPDSLQSRVLLEVGTYAVSFDRRRLSEEVHETFPPPPPGCTFEEKIGRPEGAETALTVLEWVSVGILSIMLLEICLTIYALGREWISIMHIVDAAIVIASLALEIALRTDEDLRNALELLIIARLWRIVRIFQSFEEAYHIQHETKLEEVQKKHEREVAELKAKLEEFKEVKTA